ncbi:beta-galactosidase [Compostimonas suwonensis]|uniref:beta-galactosidase n=1 Tax=Compostimonas suwonensis TaxID=1048394 RepID=A0A2M9BCV1_9MICO|nr:beta-galactosidase [Compostimonas suwonensis]PJJ55781.1 beta-galactosidase [Compostimonas suwonensis]
MMRGLRQLTQELGIAYGGDYNPEQWSPEVWRDDVRLMAEAGVSLVTVGVFSWSRLEPQPGRYDFTWLDEVLDLLADAGIAVDLATPVASPPPWLGHLHPSTLPVTAEGVVLGYGARSHFCPSSPEYREAARTIAERLAQRYATHPAVRLWHAGNEYGERCYCDRSAEAFRGWLRTAYGSIDALNAAWGSDVWSQRYSDWSEILPPRAMPYHRNPAHDLDFRRFSSDALLDLYREQRDTIRRFDTDRPITTNLMGFFAGTDYASWAAELDIIADDAYPDPADPHSASDAALTDHLMRGLANGGSWMRMEQATSAVSWRPHNATKSPARLRTEVLQAVAHGCDAACFFQWRQARTGPERFHSAMLPSAGPDTAVHRGVRALGQDLRMLREIAGTRVEPSRVALLWDWTSWWAATQEAMPTDRLEPLETLRHWHRALWTLGVTVDVVSDPRDLSGYDAVIAPSLYVLEPELATTLDEFVAGGGVLVWGPFCGIADRLGALWQGRTPALLRHVLGVSAEEWVPLPVEGAELSFSAELRAAPSDPYDAAPSTANARATVLGERTRSDGAETLASYMSGPLAGCVAVARHRYGTGQAWYIGTELVAGTESGHDAGATSDRGPLAEVLAAALAAADVSIVCLPRGIEVAARGDAVFVINHTETSVALDLIAAAAGSPTLARLLARYAAGDPIDADPAVDLLTGRPLVLDADRFLSLDPLAALVLAPATGGPTDLASAGDR